MTRDSKHEAMVYLDYDICGFDLEEALAMLPAWRREQALRHRAERHRRENVAAYRLLCSGLALEYGIREQPAFEYEKGGKPSLAGHPGIHFSLSHSNGVVLCAIGDKPMGADIERLRHYSSELMRRVLCPEEVAKIEKSSSPDVEFACLWTMKESLLKLTGEGIRRDLKTVLQGCCLNFSTTVNLKSGYVYTICTEK